MILNHDVRALAVTGSERWYDLPDVPTMIELGHQDFVSDTFHGVFAPVGAPPDIVERLSSVLLEAIHQPALHEQLRSQGFEVTGNGPDGLRRRIKVELPRYRDLIVKAGIERV